jgi:CubicO group peptidase (beta-lactamase class C family)
MKRAALLGAVLTLLPALASAQDNSAALTGRQKGAIDESLREWLAQTGAPSVSIAVVNGGQLVYAKAYGLARIHPAVPATPQTRYDIYSATKQFTAAAILLLQQQGKLGLDDKVAGYFPDLTGADQITIRQILSHTAGYHEMWPEDVVTLEKSKPISMADIAEKWGRQPLDFTPGSKWVYSNTNFMIAGAIAEKLSGKSLSALWQDGIFEPLHMTSAIGSDGPPLGSKDAAGYTQYAGGPPELAANPGAGWKSAAGGLAMTASDLARWDISLMNRSLLAPQSYDALYASVKLNDGTDSHYSLGLGVYDGHQHFDLGHGRHTLEHGGGGPGYVSESRVWPNEKIAIVALTNSDWTNRDDIVDRVAYIVLPPNDEEKRARAIIEGLRLGKIDRSLFTEDANHYLNPEVLAGLKAGLAKMGPTRAISQQARDAHKEYTRKAWKIVTAHGTAEAIEFDHPDGKIQEFMVSKVQ